MFFELRTGRKIYFTGAVGNRIPSAALLYGMMAQGYKLFFNGRRYTLGNAAGEKRDRRRPGRG